MHQAGSRIPGRRVTIAEMELASSAQVSVPPARPVPAAGGFPNAACKTAGLRVGGNNAAAFPGSAVVEKALLLAKLTFC